MKLLVLEGGNSTERAVSLRSAESVLRALKELGHEVQRFDTKEGLNGLNELVPSVDLVMPILHGAGGEDGTVQEYLERFAVPYLGANPTVSRACFDKVATKKTIAEHGLRTPAWELVSNESYNQSELCKKPHILKPNCGGSSIDTFFMRDPSNIPNKQLSSIKDAFGRHREMLIEELIIGHEITVPILGNDALPVIEIIPPANEEFDYENKYNGKTQELCPPVNIDQNIQATAQAIATKLHNVMGVRHISRVDMMITGGEVYVLEINTIPGLTNTSLFPLSAKQAGLNMTELVARFVALAA